VVAGARHVVALPTPYDFMPPEIARYLLEQGADPTRAVTVYQRLTLPDESALHTTLGALARDDTAFSDLSILVFPLCHCVGTQPHPSPPTGETSHHA
jgi:cobalt-precorrin-7 (C5)-methyltransferase